MSKQKLTPHLVLQIYAMTARKLRNAEICKQAGVGISMLKAVRSGLYPMDIACLVAWTESFGSPSPVGRANSPSTRPAHTRVAPQRPKPAKAVFSDVAKKLARKVSITFQAVPAPAVPTTNPKEDPMLLQHQALTEQAKKHFKLFRSPFVDDISTRADVFTSGPMNYVRHALLDCAQNHGFMAVVGESGSGKTTLREELEERIREDNKPIIVIKPFVVGMEVNDAKGKTMKCVQISDAIARTLSPGLTLKSNPDARFEQVKQLLMSSVASGYNHLILIEEAHRLPQATLRHLKGFMELKDRMRRLLGVCLIGQPELDQVLVPNERTIREIVQRCERVTLAPLDAELPAYLAHKFSRVGAELKAVMEPSAFDAIRLRLQWTPQRGTPKDTVSQCYPLAVNNLVCRAMNAAARVCFDKVDADVIAGC